MWGRKTYIKRDDFESIDEDIAKFMLRFFINRLKSKIKNITFVASYNNQKDVNDVISKWSGILNVPEDKILAYKREKYKDTSIRIQINSIIFRKFFQTLIGILLPIIKENKNFRHAFLRGHFAADGSVRVVYDSKPYIEGIGFYYDIRKEQWLKDYIINCLELEGFTGLKVFENGENNEGLIKITNWSNYVKCWEIKLFDRCSRKKETFLDIMGKIEIYLRLKNNFRKYLFKSLNLTYRQIGERIGIKKKKVWEKIAGKQLLRVEQIARIIKNTHFSWGDVIENSVELRVGNLSKLNVNSSFIDFVLSERKLV